MNRRALLSSLGAAGISALTGCLGQFTAPDAATRLGLLAIENYDRESGHEFDIRVERDGDTVHRSVHSIEQTALPVISGLILDCPWEYIKGEYIVSARVDGGEWLSRPLAEPFDDVPECVISTTRYGSLPSEAIEPTSLRIEVQDRCDSVMNNDRGCLGSRNTTNTAD